MIHMYFFCNDINTHNIVKKGIKTHEIVHIDLPRYHGILWGGGKYYPYDEEVMEGTSDDDMGECILWRHIWCIPWSHTG